MIAGWNPDQRYWMTDIFSNPSSLTSWTLDNDTERWHLGG